MGVVREERVWGPENRTPNDRAILGQGDFAEYLTLVLGKTRLERPGFEPQKREKEKKRKTSTLPTCGSHWGEFWSYPLGAFAQPSDNFHARVLCSLATKCFSTSKLSVIEAVLFRRLEVVNTGGCRGWGLQGRSCALSLQLWRGWARNPSRECAVQSLVLFLATTNGKVVSVRAD